MNEQERDAALQVVRGFYESINGHDIAGCLRAFDDAIVRIEPSDFPGGGIYRGRDAVEKHFQQARANWAEGECSLGRLSVNGDRVLASVFVRVRLKHEKDWRVGRVIDGFRFERGRVTEFRTFVVEREALDWAGLESIENG